jgi:hypothetical protein
LRTPLKFIKKLTRARIMSLMILVAVSSLAAWSVKAATKYYRFKAIREQRLSKAAVQVALRQIAEKSLAGSTIPEFTQWDMEKIRHYKNLEQKYRKGASEPWIELKPDPPEPPLLLDLDQIDQELGALRERAYGIASAFENGTFDVEPEKNPIDERPDPPGSASPHGSNRSVSRMDFLTKRHAELHKELEELKKMTR